ncbi:MAG: branched-chain amino acid ABC transporter permease [Acidimicrobiales bacterium]
MASGNRVWGWLAVALVAGLALVPVFVEDATLNRFTATGVLTLAILGLVVGTGQAGLINLAQGVFVGIGAFAMGAYLDLLGLPFLVALAATVATGAGAGVVLGLPALRVRGIHLALITLGLAVLFPAVAKRFPMVTGGSSGRAVRSTLEPPGWFWSSASAWRYYWCLAVVVAAYVMVAGLLNSRAGRAMQAVRDNEVAAAAFGVDVVAAKTGAFAVSSALAATAGGLRVLAFPFVSQDQYTVFLSFRLYAAAVVGGVAELAGAVVGTATLAGVPALNGWLGITSNDELAFGVALVLLTFVAPDGLAGVVAARLRRRRAGPGPPSQRAGGGHDDDEPAVVRPRR